MKPIETMTSEELRVEIAREKGWHEVECIDDYGEKYWRIADDKNKILGQSNHQEQLWKYFAGPHWPTDIREAWGLVEEMEKTGAVFEIRREFSEDDNNAYKVRVAYDAGGPKICHVLAYAMTAPLAISRAWLMWKREEK